jgi:hypothetical protein
MESSENIVLEMSVEMLHTHAILMSFCEFAGPVAASAAPAKNHAV